MRDLLKALANEGQTPCRKFACPKFQMCADELLACSAFGYFVQTGRTLHPHHFVSPRATSKDRVKYVGEVHPTRELFDAIQHNTWAADHTTAWEDKRTAQAQEQTDAVLDEIGERSLTNWFALSVERAEKTLQHHQESTCQDAQNSTRLG